MNSPNRGSSSPRRILLAGLFHETNTFAPGQTELGDFEIIRDAAILNSKGNGSPLGAVVEEAERFDWEIIPAIDIRAMPGPAGDPKVLDIFFEGIDAAAASEGPSVDAVFFILHGAMVVAGVPDVEGEVLARIRRHPVLSGVSIFGVLDLHANFTPAMAAHSNALLTYRANPHTDATETAVRAARLLQASLDSAISLRTRFVETSIVWPPTGTGTAAAPMKTLEELARSEERDGVKEINVFAGFAHADTHHTGVSFSVVYDPKEVPDSRLDLISNKLRQAAEKEKHLGLPDEWDLDAALDDAIAKGVYPVALVEPSDNIGGGSPGDGTAILRALLKRKITGAGVILNDPDTVASLSQREIGQICDISVGGKISPFDPDPVSLKAKLLSVSDGVFFLEDRQSHLASISGTKIEMGPCAVIEVQGITLLLTSRRTPPFDLGQWRSQGVEPSAFRFIGVKAAVGHRRAYDSIIKSSYWVRTPGPCSSALRSLPYQLIRRPVFPLDP